MHSPLLMNNPSSALWDSALRRARSSEYRAPAETIVGIPHEAYFGVLAHHVAFHQAVLIARDDRYGRRFDAYPTVPPYLVFEQRDAVNFDHRARFSEVQGA